MTPEPPGTRAATSAEPLIGTRGQRQVHLPLGKAFGIALQSLRVRFWRSMITAGGVLLGIAFLGATLVQAGLQASAPDNTAGVSAEAIRMRRQEAETREQWLVALSLLVCTVGITNSLLMSVTERYKEIGTMKCLGALDSFIVKLFLLEAGMLGFLASVAGFAVGCLAAHLGGLFQYGSAVWTMVSPLALLRAFGTSLLTGTMLTVLATILPAQQAARLPPAAALRAEI